MPKFGEWDVNNPASADGFTVIFAKARDEKKTTGTAVNAAAPPPRPQPSQTSNNTPRKDQIHQHHPTVQTMRLFLFFLITKSGNPALFTHNWYI